MYDFKTFAQMNLDLIFQGFDRMPQPGEEVFAKRFTMQLGGGPIVCPIVLEQLGFRVRLGTFLGQDDVSNLCRRLLDQRGFSSYDEFAQDNPDPVVVTSVFSWEHDRGFLAHNEGVYESILDPETVYGFLRDFPDGDLHRALPHILFLKQIFLLVLSCDWFCFLSVFFL